MTDMTATPTEPSTIELNPLCTMTVRLRESLDAGNAPTGHRVIVEIASASLSGRLSGGLAGGSSADWLTMAGGGLGLPDVRLAIKTGDGAVILMRYSGRIRFRPGQESAVTIAPTFETGDPRYSWLNEIQAVGKGILSADLTTLGYEIYELQ